jgi:hypothetical protein
VERREIEEKVRRQRKDEEKEKKRGSIKTAAYKVCNATAQHWYAVRLSGLSSL